MQSITSISSCRAKQSTNHTQIFISYFHVLFCHYWLQRLFSIILTSSKDLARVFFQVNKKKRFKKVFRNTSVFIFYMTLGPGILHFCCVYCFFSLQFEMVTRSVMPQTQLMYFSSKYSRKKKHLHQSPFNISSDFAHACALFNH